MKWDEQDEEVEMVFNDQTPQEKDLKKGHWLLAKGTTLKQLETYQYQLYASSALSMTYSMLFINKDTSTSKSDPLPSLCW